MFTESELKREGRIVTAFAIIWGILALALLAKFRYLLAI